MGDPGFTFYADNFLGGTILFTDDQVGKYMRALCAQKLCGHLTFGQLNVFAKNDPMVIAKFKTDENGLYYNVRLQKEIDKRFKFSDSQSEKANKRWGKDDPPASAGAVPGDMPGQYQGICRGNARAIGTDFISDIVICSGKEKKKEEVQGKEEKETPFETFWENYPKKVGKGAAEKSWLRLKAPVETLEKIIAALKWQKKSDQWRKESGQFIPMPATYLNQKRWLDEPPKQSNDSGGWRNDLKPKSEEKDETYDAAIEEMKKNLPFTKRDGIGPQSVGEILTGMSGGP